EISQAQACSGRAQARASRPGRALNITKHDKRYGIATPSALPICHRTLPPSRREAERYSKTRQQDRRGAQGPTPTDQKTRISENAIPRRIRARSSPEGRKKAAVNKKEKEQISVYIVQTTQNDLFRCLYPTQLRPTAPSTLS
ncbi:hypothetical protein B0H19DRAFT_1234820, partial [Mycena capillaripes]